MCDDIAKQKIPPESDFNRLFEETILKRNPFQDSQTIHDIDFNSFKSDGVRSLIAQVDFASRTNRISPLCSQEIQKQLIDDYRNIVDNPNGLNNYSEEALAICNHRKNESSAWKSSLTGLSGKDMIKKYGKNIKPIKQNTQYEELFLKDLEKLKVKSDDTRTTKKLIVNKTTNVAKVEESASKPGCSFYQNNSYQRSDKQNPQFVKENHVNKPSHQTFSNPPKRKKELDTEDSISFKTAKDVWFVDHQKKNNNQPAQTSLEYGSNRKTLGARPSGLNRKFVPPIANTNNSSDKGQDENFTAGPTIFKKGDKIYEFEADKLKNIDPKMLEVMVNEILDDGPPITWDDIAGLEFAKKTIQEIVVWPLLRPDIFKGLRGPPKGILLFGPPGTGKTLIGKCIASQSKSTFFSISASSLTSKWIGEGEKLVRALFAVARILQPSVVFIDEIDSLLSQRGSDEHESSRRLKTEFLVQLDGASTSSDDSILIVGATNRPQELDEAARRRLVKRLYIPLPEGKARKTIVTRLLNQLPHSLNAQDLDLICEKTDGYSGADMANLCKEAALGPLRELNFKDIESIPSDELRPVTVEDFLSALSQVRASVSEADLETYLRWNKDFGSNIVTAK